MGAHTSFYNLMVSVAAGLGSITYGYTISTLGNNQAKTAFNEYMDLDAVSRKDYTTAIIALWNCILYVGAFFGVIVYPFISTRWGRRMPITIGAVLSIVGSALQAGSVDAAMLTVARFVAGAGTGLLLVSVPLYQAETAPPKGRGLLVGLHGSLIGYGTALAEWVGLGFFHVNGSGGWRGTFAVQIVFPVLLFVIAIFFLPESPRWLVMHGRDAEAHGVLVQLHKSKDDPDDTFAHSEMSAMKHQIDYEMAHRITFAEAMRKQSLRRRLLIGWLVMSGTQAGGLIVVLTYQSTIYAALNFSPVMTNIMSAIWCTCNGTSNLIGGLIIEKIGRVRQLMLGYFTCMCVLIILCVLTELYGGTTNHAGNSAAAAFTFFLIVAYGLGADSAAFIYSSELFPSEWRAIGVAMSITAIPIWSILFTAVASPAFANIGAKYYIVFICTSFVMIFVAYFVFPETNGLTLEQVAAVFGDEVVDMTRPDELGHAAHSHDPEKICETATEVHLHENVPVESS